MGTLNGIRVAVCGGGIAGMASALALAKNGACVTLYEQADQIREFGAGLQVSPNGARVLQALGIWPRFEAISIAARAVVPRQALSGRRLAQFDLGRYAPPYRFVHRGDLLALLHCAARGAGVCIELGASVAVRDGRPHVANHPIEADLIVGAGGLHSPLRDLLNGPAEPFFTGQVAWRAIVPSPEPAAPEAQVWMGPRRHMVTYPLPGERLNIVAVQERREWAAEGWSHEDDPAHLRHVFSRMAPELRDILARVEKVHLWGLFRHPVAARWHQDRVALVGDAAHPTLPFLAQGANLALEDAWALVACLNAAPVSEALPRYQQMRQARVRRAIKAANGNARNYHLTGARAQVSHHVLGAISVLAPSAFLGRLDWLYNYDVTAERA